MDLTGYDEVENFTSIAYSSNTAGSIADPTKYQATNGDIITVTAVNGTCQSTATFNVTVNDRQVFGICSQGKVWDRCRRRSPTRRARAACRSPARPDRSGDRRRR